MIRTSGGARWVLTAALVLTACAPGGDKNSGIDTAAAPAAATSATTPGAPRPGEQPGLPGAETTAAAAGAVATPPETTAVGPANRQQTRQGTSPSEAARLDAATRAAAKQGAETRDTAPSGQVTPPPAVRKTAAPAGDTTRPAQRADANARTGGARPGAAAPGAAATTAPGRDSSAPAAARAGSTADASTADTSTAAAASSASSTTGQAQAASGDSAQAGAQQQGSAQQQGGQGKLLASAGEYQGWKTYEVNCSRCHGEYAIGTTLAPNLRHSVSPEGSVTHEIFLQTVKEGRIPKGMPAWKDLLTDQQIENIYAYVKARSEGRLAAGRPRVKSQG